LALFHELGDGWGINHALARLGAIAGIADDQPRVKTFLEECLLLARAAGVKSAIAWALKIWADSLFRHDRELDRATAMYEESLKLLRDVRAKEGIAVTVAALSRLAFLHEDYERASILQEEGAALFRAMGQHHAPNLTGLLRLRARLARMQGNYDYAHAA